MTQLFQPPDIPTSISQFGMQDAAIAKMKAEFMPLRIAGVNDKEGEEQVHRARMIVVKARTSTEKKAKELNEEATRYTRAVHAEKNRILGLLEPIENHLKAEERRIESEREAIRFKAQREAEEKKRQEEEAERARIKAEQAAEDSRLAAERKRINEERQALLEERRKMEAAQEAERKRVEAIATAEREKVNAELRALAKERERVEYEKRSAEEKRLAAERLAAHNAAMEAEAKARKEADEQARIRAEELRPDREKLMTVASCVAGIVVPEVTSPEAMQASNRIGMQLDRCAAEIRDIVNSMLPPPKQPPIPDHESEPEELPDFPEMPL